MEDMFDCRPLGFLIGLPFALIASLLSLLAAIVWVLGSILSCLCPCCICCVGLLDLAVGLMKLPVDVVRWLYRSNPMLTMARING